MYFNSYLFIFLFVPLVLLVYFFLNHLKKYRLSQAWIVLMSLWFYSYSAPGLFVLIMVSMAGNYLFSMLMQKEKHLKLLGAAGVVFNLGLLFYFKYYDFFVSNMNAVFQTDWVLKKIALPMGISFYTFQQISYIADRSAGKAQHYDLLDYMSFVTFFPQLVAGPIVKHDELVPQFRDLSKKNFCWSNFAKGVSLFVMGLAKKVLLADILSLAADYGFSHIPSLDSLSAAATILCYAFQLYFDFSGYSDMAIGLGWMMNIDLPVNFNSPYNSRSVSEFWRRWHITLNKFFIEYVYIPLGGNRKGVLRKHLNTMIVFLLSGIWHGANWTFVVWGFCHGVIIVLESLAKKPLKWLEGSSVGRFVRWLLCFVTLLLLLVIFRAGSIGDVPQFYERLFSFSSNGSLKELAMTMDNSILYIPGAVTHRFLPFVYENMHLLYLLLMLVLAAVLSRGKNAYDIVKEEKYSMPRMLVLALLFALSVISLSKVVVFLYSNF